MPHIYYLQECEDPGHYYMSEPLGFPGTGLDMASALQCQVLHAAHLLDGLRAGNLGACCADGVPAEVCTEDRNPLNPSRRRAEMALEVPAVEKVQTATAVL